MNSHKKDWLQSWHVNPSANRDYDLIDGLRGIAILLVLACHHIYVSAQSRPVTLFIEGVFKAGGYGVTVFFALSGFLISWPFWRRKVKSAAQVVPPGYGWRRFWKIYPPLALSILMLTPIYILISNDFTYAGVAARWLVGLPLVMPVNSKLNPVMWSLVVEMHFYIVLPLLFLCLKKVSAKACLWIVFLLFLIVPVGWSCVNMMNGIYFSLHSEINDHFPSMLDNFALGILVAGLDNLGVMRKRWAKFGDLGFILLALALLTQSWLRLHPAFDEHVWGEIPDWMVRIASAFLLCYIADPQHPRARFLSEPWLRWCGIISYEWYLFHQPIVLWSRTWLGPAEGNPLKYVMIVGGAFVASLTLAALVYRFFSLPLLKYGRTKHAAEKAAPTGVAAVREPPTPAAAARSKTPH